VIVIGGGIIGLSCAWRLAQRGVSVTLFDAGSTGGEASWAGAGMLAPGGEAVEDTPQTRMAIESLKLYPEFVAELVDTACAPIDYRRTGALEIALTDEEAALLDARANKQTESGIRSESTSHPGAVSARVYPEDAIVNPREVKSALRTVCLQAGVAIRKNEPVSEILPAGRGVRTTQGTYADDSTLLAAGAWSSPLWPGLPASIPIRGHLIAYAAPAALLGPILRHRQTYLLQRTSGLLIAGTSTEHVGFNRELDGEAIDDIRRRASGLLPELGALQPVERWNGFRPGIEGDLPLIGRVDGTSLWTAYGHYRNGILLAPETARRIADLVTA
jgi:glycine oxidase